MAAFGGSATCTGFTVTATTTLEPSDATGQTITICYIDECFDDWAETDNVIVLEPKEKAVKKFIPFSSRDFIDLYKPPQMCGDVRRTINQFHRKIIHKDYKQKRRDLLNC